MSTLRILGRFLIILSLVSSAYLHYFRPNKSLPEVATNYKLVDDFANNVLRYNLPLDNTNWVKLIMILAGIQVLAAVLVLFNDVIGKVLYLLSIFLELVFLLAPKIIKKSLFMWNAWRSSQKEQLIRLLVFIGFGIILFQKVIKKALVDKQATKKVDPK